MDAVRAAESRKDEVYAAHPRLSAIDEEIAAAGLEKARIRLGYSSAADFDLKERIAALSAEKRQIFINAGFPEGDVVPAYTCPICSDTGFVNGEKCACFLKREAEMAFSSPGISSLPVSARFADFSLDWYSEDIVNPNTGISAKAAAARAYEYAKDFADNFGKIYDNILFCGPAGVGKTFLSGCIAAALTAKGHQVIYMTAIDLFRVLEDDVFRTNEETRQLTALFETCELLIIDDLGANRHNSVLDSQLFGLLNGRILARRDTIISTNLSTAELRDAYTDRIYSRIISEYKRLYLFGEDIRIQKKLHGGDQR